jgi:glycosyltransferase involved in cell wall biosynthesis
MTALPNPIRRIGWFFRVLRAAFAGAAVRLARRMARRPPRIWRGFTPLHATSWMAEADRKAGFPSVSVTIHTRALRYAIVRPEDFDRVFESETDRWDDLHWVAMIDLLRHADIWNAYYDCLFFKHTEPVRNTLAFRLIRFVGIRILVQPHGSDLLCIGPYSSRYGWPELAQVDYPEWDLTAQREVVEERVRLFARFADFLMAGDSLYEPVLPRSDLSLHPVPVDTESLVPHEPMARSTPVIVHAPNHRHVKGTAYLIDAVDRLRDRGFAFELRLIEGVPRHEALRLYADADILADQFIMGTYGTFALEGMALGKPVLTYLTSENLLRPSCSHPLVNTTPENLVEVLAVLHAVPELRTRIGAASRASVVRYQSFEAMAAVWTQIYRHVWWREPLDLQSTPPYDPARTARSLSEDPASAEFWPVPVDDLIPRITEAVRRIRLPDQTTMPS